MFSSLRQRTSDEGGFTLIELLVVILIIGILAAIAIPSLLSQKSKAYSASAKTLASSAQTAAETYGTDNNGEFHGLSATVVHEYEKNIPTAASGNNAYLKEAVSIPSGCAVGACAGYKVVTVAGVTKAEFTIERAENGEVIKTCTPAEPTKGCPTSGSW